MDTIQIHLGHNIVVVLQKKTLSTSNLDIALLRCLLLNFAQNCRTNLNLKQDVEDLVKCRNTLYGHAKEARLADSQYSKYKTEVEDIILRIARFCNIENEMRQKLNDASQRPLDESILLQYQNKLIEQSEYVNNIEEKFDEVKQQLIIHDERLHCRMDTMERKVGEIAHTEALLLEHTKDDTYIVTEDVKTCCDILEKYKALIIIAKAGGGKSKTSLQIVKMYQEKLYTPMVFVNDEILRNRDLINFDDQNIVIIEDLFGRSNIKFNEDVHTGILDVLYSCLKAESCKSKFIISIRGNDVIIRQLIERHKLFEKEMFINLDKINSLHINKLILSKHMNKHGISLCQCRLNINPFNVFRTNQLCESELFETNPNSFQVCVKLFNEICSGQYEMHIGFPQACHLFCSNSNFTKQGLEYFTHASQSLVNEMNNLKNQGFDNKQIQYQYCTLVYTAIKSSLDMEDIDERCFQHILSYFGSKKFRRSLLKAAVCKLDGTYFNLQSSSESSCDNSKRQKVSDIYVLQHNTIQEAILVSYGDDADVLPFCDLTFMGNT
ncbi:unnamed protein product [Mytilus edulis]|uniref:Novel STAND NTPase 3 domain-containing protein n=1 Tax=Mytilus edulis TaxID=6550 RepID=A0A8S3V2L5_MYTED|nr:unnamed protein product [Mytilus edulis]